MRSSQSISNQIEESIKIRNEPRRRRRKKPTEKLSSVFGFRNYCSVHKYTNRIISQLKLVAKYRNNKLKLVSTYIKYIIISKILLGPRQPNNTFKIFWLFSNHAPIFDTSYMLNLVNTYYAAFTCYISQSNHTSSNSKITQKKIHIIDKKIRHPSHARIRQSTGMLKNRVDTAAGPPSADHNRMDSHPGVRTTLDEARSPLSAVNCPQNASFARAALIAGDRLITRGGGELRQAVAVARKKEPRGDRPPSER